MDDNDSMTWPHRKQTGSHGQPKADNTKHWWKDPSQWATPLHCSVITWQSHHSGADNSAQIRGLIHHTCNDVVVTKRNHWEGKTEQSFRKITPQHQGCTFVHAALLTLCWRLPLLFTNYIKNWLLSMEKNVFHTNHLTEDRNKECFQ